MAAELAYDARLDTAALTSVLFEGEGHDDGWLAKCQYALAPNGTMVVCSRLRFGVLKVSATTGIYEVIGRGQEYVINTDDNVNNNTTTHHEVITSVACRCYKQPSSKSTTPGADITGLIVIVGYDSGYVRIFTEGGRMLVAQMLHHGAVKSIRGQPSNAVEDVAVLYDKVVVLMDGFSLVQTIRACVSRLAHGFDLSDADCPPLTLKKWGIEGQSRSSDIACFGANIPTAFENLIAHTSVAAPINRYIVSGKSPMLSMYSTAGCDQKRFSAKALASNVATKLGTAMLSVVSSWWGSGRGTDSGGSGGVARAPPPRGQHAPNAAQSDVAAAHATALHFDFDLDDPRRHIHRIELCPNDRSMLTTDGFGRVVLFDISTSAIVRVWKGYRDSQCAWIVSEEQAVQPDEEPTHGSVSSLTARHHDVSATGSTDSTRTSPGAPAPTRKCVFVVIHAPRRGLLEIWSPWFGHRVAAFNVGIGCTLVSRSPDRTTTVDGLRVGGDCKLIMKDGTIKTIRVPFESTLSRAINTGLQDLHQIRRMRSLLAPFTDSAFTPSQSSDGIVYSPTELGERLGQCITGFQSIQGLHRGLQLVRVAKLPSALIKELVRILRSSYSELMDKESAKDQDNVAKTSSRHMAMDEGAQQSRMVFATFDSSMRAWELQLQAHDALLSMATSPLQLLVQTPSDPTSDALDALHLADKLLRAAGDKMTQEYGSSNHHLNLIFSRWITLFPEMPSPEPTVVDVPAMLMYIDATTQGSGADNSHGAAPDVKFADGEVLQMAQFCFQSILSGCCRADHLRDTLLTLQVGRDTLIDLFVVWICSLPLWCILHEAVITSLCAVFRALVRMPGNTTTDWCALVNARCSVSDRCAQAFVVSVLGQSVWQGTDNRDPQLAESWDLLRHRLHDTLVLGVALAVRGTRAVSVTNLLKSGRLQRVLITHLVGLQTTRHHITDSVHADAEAFLDALRKQPHCVDKSTETSVEARRNPVHHLAFLRTRFPHAMSKTTLALRLSSAYLDVWVNDRTAGTFSLLTAAGCVCTSDNAFVSTSACLALWQHHLRGDFKKLVNLIEKVKKAPKERLCVKEVGMDTKATTKFAEATALALEHLHTEAVALAADDRGVDSKGSGGDVVVCDSRWTPVAIESKRSDASKEERFFGQYSLRELLSPSGELQLDILDHHKLLGRVVFFILKFNMRSVKPLGLFLDHIKGMLFAPFTVEHPDKDVDTLVSPACNDTGISPDGTITTTPGRVTSVPQVYEDPNQAAAAANAMEVRSARRQFLVQALGEAVARRGPQVHALSDDTTTARVFELATWFGLDDDDKLRRYYVCHLFRYGWAADAQEVLSAVVDTVVMASMLFDLAIRELAEQLDPDHNREALTLTSKLPGYVYEWCQAAAYVPGGTASGVRPGSGGGGGANVGAGESRIDKVTNIIESAVPLATDRCADRDRILRLHAALVDL
eukprot:m.1247534 g.1247534  ORF g.1247534 m.1247534 type:complete len:1453 (-) comp24691_c0_seq3:262-4620(-)